MISDDFYHPEARFLHRVLPKHGKRIEDFLMRSAAEGAGKTMKYIIQLLIAWTSFYWFVPVSVGADSLMLSIPFIYTSSLFAVLEIRPK